jgi:hypothetical protein
VLNGSRGLVWGSHEKPDVDDNSESSSYVLMDLLAAQVSYPFLPVIGITSEHAYWAHKRSFKWNGKNIRSLDASADLNARQERRPCKAHAGGALYCRHAERDLSVHACVCLDEPPTSLEGMQHYLFSSSTGGLGWSK